MLAYLLMRGYTYLNCEAVTSANMSRSDYGVIDELAQQAAYANVSRACELYKHLEEYKMRTKITLACTECKNRNYNTTKEKKNHPDRMETKKYCRFCQRHTLHKETK